MFRELMSFKTLAFALLLSSSYLCAQSADDYFHSGGQYYIHGKTQKSKETVDLGISLYPNDKKLNELRKKIKEEEKKQNQQNQNQNQDKNQDQQGKSKQENKKHDENEKQTNPYNKDPEQPEKKPKPSPPNKDMEKDKALRLLRQYADDDKDLNKPKKKIHLKKPEKDW